MAAYALSIIPGAVLRNLADKLYEKRKNAALEVRDFDCFWGPGAGPRSSNRARDLRRNFCCGRVCWCRLRGS